MKNPLRHVFDFRRQELPVVVLLFLFFFLAIAVFQMLYPLKKGLFLENYGAGTELYAKLLNIVAAGLAVTAFTLLYNRLRRQHVVYVLCGFFMASFFVLAQLLSNPGAVAIWGFYLLGDLITTLMVATFWAYSTDISSPDQAKRLFGVIGAGGIVGGVAGSTLTRSLMDQTGILHLAIGMMAAIALVVFVAEAQIQRSGVFQRAVAQKPAPEPGAEQPSKMGAAMEGARLVMRSKYLAAIVGIMAFYEMASQTMDYQFGTIAESVAGVTATQAFVADIRLYANVLSLVMQFFLVSLIMRKLGLVAALLVLPLAVAGSSLGFLMVTTLPVASLLHISDNGLNYSIQQTARESLYVVTTPDEKYKARAFTNMFVQRVAKGLSVLMGLGLAFLKVDIGYLSLITIAVAVGMVLCSIYAGRQFALKNAARAEA